MVRLIRKLGELILLALGLAEEKGRRKIWGDVRGEESEVRAGQLPD